MSMTETDAIPRPEPAPAMPSGPISGPSAWYGRDMAERNDWIYHLSPSEAREVEDALVSVQRHGLEIIDIEQRDFPLPSLGPILDAIRLELLTGRGFVLLRGLGMENRSVTDAATIFWGIGRYLGRAVSQNGKGHLLGHVHDLGYHVDDPNARVYQTTERQCYHTDSCDIVGLFCVRPAKSGGLSSITSSVTLFNEMLARSPVLTRAMFRPFCVDRRGEVPDGMKPYFTVPILNWHAGNLSTYYVRRYIESAQRFPEVPRLTSEQIQALDLIDALADDPALHLKMDFQPGDMQFLHNHQILHDRTAFEDWSEPSEKRHLLRLWLCPPDGRAIPACYSTRYGGTEIGRRGGIQVPGAILNVPLEPV